MGAGFCSCRVFFSRFFFLSFLFVRACFSLLLFFSLSLFFFLFFFSSSSSSFCLVCLFSVVC